MTSLGIVRIYEPCLFYDLLARFRLKVASQVGLHTKPDLSKSRQIFELERVE